MKTFKKVTTQELTTLVCDGCGLKASADDDFEFHEFISIGHHCGYSSIHGDGNQLSVDLCQHCFADMCGGTLMITEERNAIPEGNYTAQLEYSNIFDVICQSKDKVGQLKDNCDLRLASREMLLKNKITSNDELTVALKRVEQLWDAQYQSTEGNELHQLVDLICAYEKKDWDSFFEQAPLADDDFISSRLNFKSKLSFNEEKTASGMLSNIPFNTEVDDESSRDSVLADKHLDETKQDLIESITKALQKHPELRLGQLLINAMNFQQPCPELFHIEDNVLAKKFNQFG